jgi:hypothetical protein
MTHRGLSKFSKKDAEALSKYEAMLERVADFLEPTLVQTTPNPWSMAPGNLLQLLKLGLAFKKLGTDGQKAVESSRCRQSDPRSLVRIGRGQGDDRHRCDHRRFRHSFDAGTAMCCSTT